MRLERSVNTKRNIIVGEADRLIGILLPFIVRTLIIHIMGAKYLGLTGLFYSIIQMLNLAELGFGTAIVYSMYKPIADGDSKAINALLKYYAKVYRIVGAVILAAGLLVMLFLPRMVKDEVPGNINIYILYFIYLFSTVINCFLYPNRKALLSAFQRDDEVGRAHIITQVIMYALQIVSIVLAKDFYMYALTVPVTSILFSILSKRRADRLFPDYKEEGQIDPDKNAEIKKQVTGLMIRRAAMMSRNAFDSMFITAFLGLEINAIYGNYYYIMDAVVMILAVIKTSMSGGVGNSIAMESTEKNMRDMNSINFLFMIISGWCAIIMLCLYQPFMILWAGSKLLLPVKYAVVFSLYFYILKMSDIRSLYSESAGIWWQMRYLSVAEAIANIILNWCLIKMLGLMGVILASMISYFIFNFIGGAVMLYRCYFTKEKMAGYFIKHAVYLVVTVVIGAATFWVVSFIGIEGIIGLIVKAIVSVIIPVILYTAAYIWTKDKKAAEPFIRKMLRKRNDVQNMK